MNGLFYLPSAPKLLAQPQIQIVDGHFNFTNKKGALRRCGFDVQKHLLQLENLLINVVAIDAQFGQIIVVHEELVGAELRMQTMLIHVTIFVRKFN